MQRANISDFIASKSGWFFFFMWFIKRMFRASSQFGYHACYESNSNKVVPKPLRVFFGFWFLIRFFYCINSIWILFCLFALPSILLFPQTWEFIQKLFIVSYLDCTFFRYVESIRNFHYLFIRFYMAQAGKWQRQGGNVHLNRRNCE